MTKRGSSEARPFAIGDQVTVDGHRAGVVTNTVPEAEFELRVLHPDGFESSYRAASVRLRSGDARLESNWACFWCGSMQAHETGYPGGMSTVPACAAHAAEHSLAKLRSEVARPCPHTAVVQHGGAVVCIDCRDSVLAESQPARLDADGTARPLTEIVAVMPPCDDPTDTGRTVHAGQATHYVARPTEAAQHTCRASDRLVYDCPAPGCGNGPRQVRADAASIPRVTLYEDNEDYMTKARINHELVAEMAANPGAGHEPRRVPGAALLHELKTWPNAFDAIEAGTKHHEVRKNDRRFIQGDILHLREWDPSTEKYTGRGRIVRVSFVSYGGAWGLPEDICVMSIERVDAHGTAEAPTETATWVVTRRSSARYLGAHEWVRTAARAAHFITREAAELAATVARESNGDVEVVVGLRRNEAMPATCSDGTDPDEPADRGFVCEHEAEADELREKLAALDAVADNEASHEGDYLAAIDKLARALKEILDECHPLDDDPCPYCYYPYGYKVERSGKHPDRCPIVIADEALNGNGRERDRSADAESVEERCDRVGDRGVSGGRGEGPTRDGGTGAGRPERVDGVPDGRHVGVPGGARREGPHRDDVPRVGHPEGAQLSGDDGVLTDCPNAGRSGDAVPVDIVSAMTPAQKAAYAAAGAAILRRMRDEHDMKRAAGDRGRERASLRPSSAGSFVDDANQPRNSRPHVPAREGEETGTTPEAPNAGRSGIACTNCGATHNGEDDTPGVCCHVPEADSSCHAGDEQRIDKWYTSTSDATSCGAVDLARLVGILDIVRRETIKMCVAAIRQRAEYMRGDGYVHNVVFGVRNVALWLESEAGQKCLAAPFTRAADSSGHAATLDREEVKRAVNAFLGWHHGWCADCEPVSRREDVDHHEEGCGYWEAVQALAKLVGLTRWADHETVEQITDRRWYRRHRFGGKIEAAWPDADAADAALFTSAGPKEGV